MEGFQPEEKIKPLQERIENHMRLQEKKKSIVYSYFGLPTMDVENNNLLFPCNMCSKLIDCDTTGAATCKSVEHRQAKRRGRRIQSLFNLYQQLWDQSVAITSELNRFCCLAFCKNHLQEYQETFQKINPTAHRVLSEHNASSYSVKSPKCDLENVAYNSCLLATTL
ncbi:hypothetical protein PROFUN_16790 [Planoprotostelium fungivorum]|uniref:Uncharacterized protein n=1 Tax=Planoprotostelium fungivorum TaxID=1890364 RepID=A0A2P6MNX0_9EUKA|nr:hypothetical protein PROFUN_16790 [Planoprotostelium fungivorum]